MEPDFAAALRRNLGFAALRVTIRAELTGQAARAFRRLAASARARREGGRLRVVADVAYTPPPPEREFEIPPEPIKPHRQPAMGPDDWEPRVSSPPLPCCAPPAPVSFDTDPLALFNALGAALGVGVAIGGLLVYAFSRPTLVEVLEQ